VKACEPFREVRREPLEFRGKGLFSEFDGILKPLTYSGLLLLKHFGTQGDEILRRLDGRVRDLQIEQAVERGGIVAGVVERAETPLGLALDGVVLVGEFPGGFLESLAVGLHGAREQPERVLRKEPDASLGERQCDRPPVARGFRANGSHGTVGGVLRVEDEFAGREQFPVGMEGSGRRRALLRGEGLPDAQPREREFHGGHGCPEPVCRVAFKLAGRGVGWVGHRPARLAGRGFGRGCCGHNSSDWLEGRGGAFPPLLGGVHCEPNAAFVCGVEMVTTEKPKWLKPQQASRAWWARAAYNGQNRDAALAALQATGIPLKPVHGATGLLSAMARGDALIKGAAGLSLPRRKGKTSNTRHLRLLQWRLAMGYAGFEIFAKACIGRSDRAGLKPNEVTTLLSHLSLRSKPHISPPVITARSSQWLLRDDAERAIDKLEAFLHLGGWEKDFLHAWFKGRPVTCHLDACHLAKILRHATVHGVLSPDKCRGLGLTEALKVLPRAFDDIRLAVIGKLYACR
jgi:hypothetical protein